MSKNLFADARAHETPRSRLTVSSEHRVSFGRRDGGCELFGSQTYANARNSEHYTRLYIRGVRGIVGIYRKTIYFRYVRVCDRSNQRRPDITFCRIDGTTVFLVTGRYYSRLNTCHPYMFQTSPYATYLPSLLYKTWQSPSTNDSARIYESLNKKSRVLEHS